MIGLSNQDLLPSAQPGRRRARVWSALGWTAAITFILAVHALGRVGAYCSPIRADSYTYASFGHRIAQGEVLYRDVIDAKPPGIFLLNAAVYAVVDGRREVLIPLESLFMLAGYLAIYKLAAQLYNRTVGLIVTVAAALAISFFLLADYTAEGFNLAENYMIVTTAAAAWCYVRADRTERPRFYFAAGVLLGLGLVLKQTVLPLVAAVVLHQTVWTISHARAWRTYARNVWFLILGGALGLLPFVLFLLIQGTATVALKAVTFSAAGFLNRASAWPSRWSDITPLWVPLGWTALGLLIWMAAGRRRPSTGRPPPGYIAPMRAIDASFLIIWLALECGLLVYLPHRSLHYYVLSGLPLLLLSGLLWANLLSARSRLPAARHRAVIAVVAIWSALLARPAIDLMVPTAVARARAYDAAADHAYFDRILKAGPVDLR